MQAITPIHNDERFIARGTYTHYQQGEPTGFYQHWSIHHLGSNRQRVRVHMDGQAADGRSILIEFTRQLQGESGVIEQCHVQATGTAQDMIKQVEAVYRFAPDHVVMERKIDGAVMASVRVDLPDGYVVRLASVLLTGYAVSEMAMQNGKDVAVVAYRPQFKDDRAFGLHVYNQSALFLKNEAITVGGRLYQARLYKRWVSDNPETVFNVWLDDDDIPLKHADGDGYRRFILTEYIRE